MIHVYDQTLKLDKANLNWAPKGERDQHGYIIYRLMEIK